VQSFPSDFPDTGYFKIGALNVTKGVPVIYNDCQIRLANPWSPSQGYQGFLALLFLRV